MSVQESVLISPDNTSTSFRTHARLALWCFAGTAVSLWLLFLAIVHATSPHCSLSEQNALISISLGLVAAVASFAIVALYSTWRAFCTIDTANNDSAP